MAEHVKSYIPGTSEFVDAHGRTGAHEAVAGLATLVPGTSQHHESKTFPGSGMYQGTPAGPMDAKAGEAKEAVEAHLPGTKEQKEANNAGQQ